MSSNWIFHKLAIYERRISHWNKAKLMIFKWLLTLCLPFTNYHSFYSLVLSDTFCIILQNFYFMKIGKKMSTLWIFWVAVLYVCSLCLNSYDTTFCTLYDKKIHRKIRNNHKIMILTSFSSQEYSPTCSGLKKMFVWKCAFF